MKVIAQQNEWLGRETGQGTAAMAGWELADEIDMLGSPESGYGTLSQIRGRSRPTAASASTTMGRESRSGCGCAGGALRQ